MNSKSGSKYADGNMYGDSRYASQILKLDTAYVESIVSNYGDNNTLSRVEKIFTSFYPKTECTCPLCNAGNKKKQHRPAVFIPTEAGYFFKCLSCMQYGGLISLYQLLLKLNPEVAKNYQWDRWVKKLTGKGFNCPDPPKKNLREYYARIEEEQKQRNRIAYQERHGLSE